MAVYADSYAHKLVPRGRFLKNISDDIHNTYLRDVTLVLELAAHENASDASASKRDSEHAVDESDTRLSYALPSIFGVAQRCRMVQLHCHLASPRMLAIRQGIDRP